MWFAFFEPDSDVKGGVFPVCTELPSLRDPGTESTSVGWLRYSSSHLGPCRPLPAGDSGGVLLTPGEGQQARTHPALPVLPLCLGLGALRCDGGRQ